VEIARKGIYKKRPHNSHPCEFARNGFIKEINQLLLYYYQKSLKSNVKNIEILTRLTLSHDIIQVQQAKYWRLQNCDKHNIVRFPCKVYSLQIPFLANTVPCEFHFLISLINPFLANPHGCELWGLSLYIPFLAISTPFLANSIPCKFNAPKASHPNQHPMSP